MVYINLLSEYLNKLNENSGISNKCKNASNIKILVSKDVYDKAEKIAKELNTDVEKVFNFAAYRFIIRTPRVAMIKQETQQ